MSLPYESRVTNFADVVQVQGKERYGQLSQVFTSLYGLVEGWKNKGKVDWTIITMLRSVPASRERSTSTLHARRLKSLAHEDKHRERSLLGIYLGLRNEV